AGLRRHDGPGRDRRSRAGDARQVRRRHHAAAQDLLARDRGAAGGQADQGLAPYRARRGDADRGRSSEGDGVSMKRLDGKGAIVFGAGPNIGGTIAHFLAREGARVAVTDVDGNAAAETVAFLTSRGLEAVALTGNAFVEDDVARMVTETVKHYGALDCVMN